MFVKKNCVKNCHSTHKSVMSSILAKLHRLLREEHSKIQIHVIVSAVKNPLLVTIR
jgi:hypothetical protein